MLRHVDARPPTHPPAPPCCRSIKPADKSGWFFSVYVNNKDGPRTSISCNISAAELHLIRVLLNVSEPARRGWGRHLGACLCAWGSPATSPEHGCKLKS